MPARRLRITGIVQGVFYRAGTKAVAEELELTGYVRNLPDGDVEIFAQGSLESLDALENWCWNGPEKADVTDVAVTEVPEESCLSFDILR